MWSYSLLIFSKHTTCQQQKLCFSINPLPAVLLILDSSTTKASDGKEEYLLERKNAKFENLWKQFVGNRAFAH